MATKIEHIRTEVVSTATILPKLGKKAAKVDPRTLKLSKYLKLPLNIKGTGGYQKRISSFPMYLNDQLGDCVIAAAAHQVQQWEKYAWGRPASLTNQDVLKGYEAVGGYIPGDPSTDRGCIMLDALNYWRKTGFSGHKIYAYAQLNPKNILECVQAITLFGSLFIGLALPWSASNQDGIWSVPVGGLSGDGSWGSWGGHAVPVVGYNAESTGKGSGLMVVTWGQRWAMTWQFLQAYCDEAYVCLAPDWIEKSGVSPSSFDLETLQKDLAEITR